MNKKIYDGSELCQSCSGCPVAELDTSKGMVSLFDPHKPENGSFKMTVSEWNTLLANANSIQEGSKYE